MFLGDPCPDCGGTVVYLGLFVIECATPSCVRCADAPTRVAIVEPARAAMRAIVNCVVDTDADDEGPSFAEIARDVFAYV